MPIHIASCFPNYVTKTKQLNLDGVTLFLDRAVPVIMAADGTFIMESSTEFNIIGVDPPAQILDGYWAHGMMIDPVYLLQQGFDEIAGVRGSPYTPYTWNGDLDVDPGHTGVPFHVNAGDAITLVKSVRLAGVTVPVTQWETIDHYTVFSIMPVLPPFLWFRPGMAPGNKIARPPANFNVFRSLALTPGAVTISEAEASNYIRRALPLWGEPRTSAEWLRRLQTDTSNYASYLAQTRSRSILALHSDAALSQKITYGNRVFQHGIDVISAYDAGWPGAAGAGQHAGYLPFAFASAFGFNDAAMLASAQAIKANMVTQMYEISQDFVGVAAGYPSEPGNSYARHRQTYFQESVGGVAWIAASNAEEYDTNLNDSGYQSRYRVTADGATFVELLATMLLVNGPGGIDGAQAISGAVGGPSAMLYADQIRTFRPSSYSGSGVSDADIALYNSWRPLVSSPRWTGVPLQIPVAESHAAAGVQSVLWDFKSVDFSTNPVIRKDVRISTDRRQWLKQTGVADTGVFSGCLVGIPYTLQLRQASALGDGRWSRIGNGTTEKVNEATPTGSPANAAPVSTIAPIIAMRPYSNWMGETFEPCPTNVPDALQSFYASQGFWSGHPAPTYSFQWQRDGVDIPLATDDFFERSPSDAGADISCVVTATNSQGDVSVSTNAVKCPTLNPTKACYIPNGIIGALPNRFSMRWQSAVYNFLFDDGYGKTIYSTFLEGSSTAPVGQKLFFSLDSCPILGDLSSVSQGDLFSTFDYGGNKNFTQGQGLVFCASNDAASANGYMASIVFPNETTCNLVLTRFNNGLASVLATVPFPTGVYNKQNNIRVNFTRNGTDLTIKVKAWMRPIAVYQDFSRTEPAGWMIDIPDPNAHPAGRLGIGNNQSRAPRRFYGLNISLNPTVPAPQNPNIPHTPV
jgi:hypothetical protein